MRYITPLEALDRADLAQAGGKGANLGALIRAGLPVPGGFCVTTAGYRDLVAANRLGDDIWQQLARLDEGDPAAREPAAHEPAAHEPAAHEPAADQPVAHEPAALDAASAAIRALFERGAMPQEMAAEIRAAYRALSEGDPAAVAVRSSATAEDLPDLSFAGQQDTYLNIVGEEALLDAVARCWASLWTARAIGYRARNQIDQAEVALAVVVQRMVPSEAAGVLFTANPLTGRRCETVIDATLGLGEALVSGMVEPDHYVVDDDGGEARILHKTLGSKARAVRGLAGGGTRVVDEASAAVQALPDAQILELARYGREAERFFGAPQDMEWAWAGGRLYVLQSRAITSLYPLPERQEGRRDARRYEVYFSFASWQGMLQPISPLGRDAFTGLVVGFSRVFGGQADPRDQNVLLEAGDRLYVNLTGLLRNPVGRAIASVFVDSIDPVALPILEELLKDPRLALDEKKMGFSTRLRMARVLAPLFAGIVYNLLWPARGRARLQKFIDRLLEQARQDTRLRGSTMSDISATITAVQELPYRSPQYLLPYLLPGIISGMAPLQVMLRMARQVEDGPRLALELTRGLPHNVTTEMDLRLWAVSRAIRSDADSTEIFQAASAGRLSALYLAGRLPAAAQQAVEGFMRAYGMRAVAEIDMFIPRWREQPLHILQVLKSYLEMEDDANSPEAVFRGGAEKARLAGEALAAGFRRKRFGAVRALQARFLISRAREMGGLRETPKFTIVRLLGVVRQALLEAGELLAAQGMLACPEDIFFLHLWELKDLAAGALPDAQRLVEQRRQTYQREMNRRRVPRILLSDGTSYYDGAGSRAEQGDGALTGSPVSAGTVEGTVRVVLDPHGSRLLPGEILVCPATDPAWTPLFLAAGGLVMEIGGMMTHGSVVAREYGIPAVVGVSQATTRLRTGQRVRVDGSLGTVQVLE